ncbi:hypothetical protein SUGI_0597460 [Cryptomeria japonica]|nr:hypothetical protein SUGI_0597460 [Cryptomeria japonica]
MSSSLRIVYICLLTEIGIFMRSRRNTRRSLAQGGICKEDLRIKLLEESLYSNSTKEILILTLILIRLVSVQ